jgi:hypothetical protein
MGTFPYPMNNRHSPHRVILIVLRNVPPAPLHMCQCHMHVKSVTIHGHISTPPLVAIPPPRACVTLNFSWYIIPPRIIYKKHSVNCKRACTVCVCYLSNECKSYYVFLLFDSSLDKSISTKHKEYTKKLVSL